MFFCMQLSPPAQQVVERRVGLSGPVRGERARERKCTTTVKQQLAKRKAVMNRRSPNRRTANVSRYASGTLRK